MRALARDVTPSTAETPRAAAPAGTPAPAKRLVYIDVLRGVAILAVMLHHLPEGLLQAFGALGEMGGRGVDLFFVLSGYLIGTTALARASTGATPWAQTRAFWLLRTVRIWPLYFGLLAVYALGPPLIDPTVTMIVQKWPAPYLTFTSNDFGQATLELGVFWSLAIEEQFYLVVALLVLACARNRETLAAAFLAMAIVALAVSLRTRHELWDLRAAGHLPQNLYIFRLYHSTLSRIDQLAMGLVCAVVALRLNASRWALAEGPRARLWTWLGVAAATAALVFFPTEPTIEFTVVGVLFALAVLHAQRPAARVSSLRAWERPLVALLATAGKLSFGLFLFHPFTRQWVAPILESLGMAATPEHAASFAAVWIPLTWVLAWVSYRFLEEPLLARARTVANRWVGKKAAMAA